MLVHHHRERETKILKILFLLNDFEKDIKLMKYFFCPLYSKNLSFLLEQSIKRTFSLRHLN